MRLQVAGARPHDVGRGIARVSAPTLQRLGIDEGGPIEIIGRRVTAAAALRLPFEDRGLELLRIDGLQRANAGAGLGDFVEIQAARMTTAARVRLAAGSYHMSLAAAPDVLRRSLLGRMVVAGDILATSAPEAAGSSGGPPLALQEVRLRVVSTVPDGVVMVSEGTLLDLIPEPVEVEEGRQVGLTYDDLGGLGDAVTQLRELVELPLKHPELFQRLGIDPPRGVLLHGPPGTGKTLLGRAVACESDARFFYVGGPEIVGPYQGESEQRLRELFQMARKQAPAIIFIDEIESIAPHRDASRAESERRLVAQLLSLMDGLEPRRNVVVIGATNLVDAIDPALRRPGRFDREITVGVPDREGRREILAIHTRGMPLTADVDLDAVARITHGFVGADLAALTREAALDALRRSLRGVDLAGGDLPRDVLSHLSVEGADFAAALRRVQPSAMREVAVQIPDVRWSDVGGVEEAKRILREGIELPLRAREAFRRLGVRPARGFLLFGPPGTGKTMLAKAVARESEANFIGVKSSELLSKWYGESERQVAKLFARARQVAPAIVFLDEIDSLAPHRDAMGGDTGVTARVVNALLVELDGLEAMRDVVVIGATNRPTLIDPALLRPGRFDELIYVPPPERAARLEILRVLTEPMPIAEDVELSELADATEGYTGADLEGLVRRAGLLALRDNENVAEVEMTCFQRALRESHPSVTAEIIREYERAASELRRERAGGRQIGFASRLPPEPPRTP